MKSLQGQFWLFLGMFIAAGTYAGAELFFYTDEAGVKHAVTNRDDIPTEYRDKTVTIGVPKARAFGAKELRADVPADLYRWAGGVNSPAAQDRAAWAPAEDAWARDHCSTDEQAAVNAEMKKLGPEETACRQTVTCAPEGYEKIDRILHLKRDLCLLYEMEARCSRLDANEREKARKVGACR